MISGGAYGVDAAAHQGCLAAEGRSIAFLGVSSDQIYPRSNRNLFAEILKKGGALVSEHPPGAPTHRGDHAKRNRLIAAGASKLLIAEAGDRSGTLNTARWARRYGVELRVSPEGVGAKRDGIEKLLRKRWASMEP